MGANSLYILFDFAADFPVKQKNFEKLFFLTMAAQLVSQRRLFIKRGRIQIIYAML